MQKLIDRAEALIDKAIRGGSHVGINYNKASIPATIAAGLPSEVVINGQRIRITDTAAEVLAADGSVAKTQPITDALRETLLVSHAVAVARGA